MTWQTVAKKDIKDSVRSRSLWAIIAIFLALILLLSWFLSPSGDGEETLLASIGLSFVFGVLLFVPLAGLFLSIKSVVREKESGSINLLLSLPHTRLDMVIGKFAGRAVVLTAAILVAFGPASVFLLFNLDGIGGAYQLFALLLSIVLFGLMFIGVGVGLSALANTETQALILGIVIFLLMYLWEPILTQLGVNAPDIVRRFWLIFLFTDLFSVFASLNDPDISNASSALETNAGATTSPDFWLQHWFVFVILALWIVVPLGIGYYRFKSQDL